MEAEDGTMRGRQALYDFDDGVFKDGFSGKGYATLNRNVVRITYLVGRLSLSTITMSFDSHFHRVLD